MAVSLAFTTLFILTQGGIFCRKIKFRFRARRKRVSHCEIKIGRGIALPGYYPPETAEQME